MNKTTASPAVGNLRRIAIYARVSTRMQAQEGYSLDDQVQMCISHCDRTFGPGKYVSEVFREEGRSGQKRPRQMGATGREERKVVSELVDRIDAGDFTDVVCYEVTRSNRDPYFWHWFKQEVCEANGVTLRFVVGDLNCDDEDDEFFADFQALIGQREAKMTGRRIRDGRRRALEQGYWPHGQNPWGWVREQAGNTAPGQRRRLVPVPDKAEVLLHMKRRLLEDGWGCRKIAAEVQQMGVPSGKVYPHWTTVEVHRKLTNPVHAGYIEDADGQLIEGAHKQHALWDLDTYYQILTVLSTRRPEMSDRHRSADFPLGGVLRCGHCRRFLKAYRAPQTGNRFYRCGSAEDGEGRDCPGVMKRADRIEACVVQAIRDFASSPRMQQLVGEEGRRMLSSRQDELRNERNCVARDLAAKDAELQKFADAFAKGLMNEQQFAKVSLRWQEEEARLQDRLREIDRRLEHQSTDERMLGMVRQALEQFDDTWTRLDGMAKRELLKGLIEELTLRREGEDDVCCVKLHILPAVDYHLPAGPGGGTVSVDGVGQITPRQVALLAHVLDGLDFQQIAERWNVNPQCVYGLARRIKAQAGSDDLEAIAREAAPFIEASRAWLPLDGRVMDENRPRQVRLSPRQIDVLMGYAEGKNRKEIAQALGLHPTSVSVRMTEIKQKLGTTGIEESMAEAKRLGLIGG